MNKFEVGKVYQARDCGTMIRITHRSDKSVRFEGVTLEGRTYPMDEYKFKIVKEYSWSNGEWFSLYWGCSFYATDVVDYDAVCKDYMEKRKAEESSVEAKIAKEAEELREWLKEHNLTATLCDMIYDKMSNMSWAAFKILYEEERVNQKKVLMAIPCRFRDGEKCNKQEDVFCPHYVDGGFCRITCKKENGGAQ